MSDPLPPALADVVDSCLRSTPGVTLDPRVFVARLEACKPADRELDDWLREVHVEDLYLASACAAGSAAALALFAQRYRDDVHHVLRGSDGRGADDAYQILQQRLFVGARPKIATYSGRAPLRRWVRVVASRVMLEVIAKREPLADEHELAALVVPDDDPALAHVKRHYRAAYKAAFADAVAGLRERDRVMLAQYYVDQLTIDQLGALYTVHRTTASRWIARAERELRDRLIACLRERLRVSTPELRSLTRLVCSRLTLSLARALRSKPETSASEHASGR